MNIPDAYDPESFRASAHAMVDRIADYLAGVQALPVLPHKSPELLFQQVPAGFPEQPEGNLIERLGQVLEHSIHVHHPRYFGHQVAAVLPAAVLAEMVSALLNNGMAVFEMGQMHTVLERQLIDFMASELGYPASARGVLTSGGSLGNLTALLAARQLRAGNDVWQEGQEQPYALMVSEECHYSVTRAAQIMGWGEAGVYLLPTDEDYRIRPESLAPTLQRARDDGREVLAVVANLCSTATGAFDPIEEMADFCGREGLWLHADGAHGASFVMSPKHRHLLRGVERADSVVWDLHKMLMLPATITGVLFRDGHHSYAAFAQKASYLFSSEPREEQWHNIGQRTLECTKRGMASVAHSVLQHHGLALFREYLDLMVARTQALADEVRASDDFELACAPACNIICLRYVGPSPLGLNQTQQRLRAELVQSGDFYIVQATLRGSTFLRLTLVNPRTSQEDLSALLQEIRRRAPLLQTS